MRRTDYLWFVLGNSLGEAEILLEVGDTKRANYLLWFAEQSARELAERREEIRPVYNAISDIRAQLEYEKNAEITRRRISRLAADIGDMLSG